MQHVIAAIKATKAKEGAGTLPPITDEPPRFSYTLSHTCPPEGVTGTVEETKIISPYVECGSSLSPLTMSSIGETDCSHLHAKAFMNTKSKVNTILMKIT